MSEMVLPQIVYVLCAVMSLLCAAMLARAYRRSSSHLLLWSSVCFAALALNNLVLFIDMIILPGLDIDGQFWRSLIAAGAGSSLLFGLIWETT